MKRTIFLPALILAAVLCLAGCNQTTSAGQPPLPPFEQPENIYEANEIPSDSNDVLPENAVFINGNDNFEFPDWNSDFSQGLIPLERFVWHLAAAGSTFRHINTEPLEFANQYIVVYFQPGIMGATVGGVNVRNPDGSGVASMRSFIEIGDGPVGQTTNGEMALGLELAQYLWDTMAIANTFTSSDTFMANFMSIYSDRLNSRNKRHNELQELHRRLEKSEIDITNTPSEWFTRSREPRISIDTFNAAISAHNANFRPVGTDMMWNNGFLTIEVLHNGAGWGIVIYDDANKRVEAFDGTD